MWSKKSYHFSTFLNLEFENCFGTFVIVYHFVKTDRVISRQKFVNTTNQKTFDFAKFWPNKNDDMSSSNHQCNLAARYRSIFCELFLRLFLVLPYILFFIIVHQKMFLSFTSVFTFWVIFTTNSSVLCEILAFIELLLQFSEELHFILWKSLIQSVYQLLLVQQVKF